MGLNKSNIFLDGDIYFVVGTTKPLMLNIYFNFMHKQDSESLVTTQIIQMNFFKIYVSFEFKIKKINAKKLYLLNFSYDTCELCNIFVLAFRILYHFNFLI